MDWGQRVTITTINNKKRENIAFYSDTDNILKLLSFVEYKIHNVRVKVQNTRSPLTTILDVW
jgi:hypothetical protein